LGTRTFLLLIFLLAAAEVFACTKCHKPHYSEVGTCSACHRGEMRSSRENVSHAGLLTAKYSAFYIDKKAVAAGERIVTDSACRRCHNIGADGGTAAADLNASAMKYTGEYLDDKIKNVNEYMPDFHFTDGERRVVILYLLNAASKQPKKVSEPYVAYITPSKKGAFEKHCGGCHRMITRIGGGKGTGNEAANLSGLLTEYFVSSVLPVGEKHWTEKRLKEWLKNPRSINKLAVMPPVRITDAELDKVIKDISGK